MDVNRVDVFRGHKFMTHKMEIRRVEPTINHNKKGKIMRNDVRDFKEIPADEARLKILYREHNGRGAFFEGDQTALSAGYKRLKRHREDERRKAEELLANELGQDYKIRAFWNGVVVAMFIGAAAAAGIVMVYVGG